MKIDEFVRYDGSQSKVKKQELDNLYLAVDLSLKDKNEFWRFNKMCGGQLFILTDKTLSKLPVTFFDRCIDASHAKSIDEVKRLMLFLPNDMWGVSVPFDRLLDAAISPNELAAFLKTTFNSQNGFANVDGDEFNGVFVIYVEGEETRTNVINYLRGIFGVPTTSAIESCAWIV